MNMSHTTGLWQDQKLNVDLLMLSFLNVTATQIYIQLPVTEEASEDYNNLKYYAFPVSHDNLNFLPVHCFQIEVSATPMQKDNIRKVILTYILFLYVCMEVNPRTEQCSQSPYKIVEG